MLKNIPELIPPDLLKILAEMGHGDEIVIADANYPAVSCAKRTVYAAGVNAVDMLDAVLTLLPLDQYVPSPAALMAVTQHDEGHVPAIWKDFTEVIHRRSGETNIEYIDRFAFYERAKNAFAVISTGERRLYGCVIVKKGVIA